jgi:transcriptional regulator with XRE-family HTH domain
MWTFKNYLRSCRRRIGLSQRQLAGVLGLRSATRISLMELGRGLPNARECIVFRMLFKRPFEEMWPGITGHAENKTLQNLWQLITDLETTEYRSNRRREQADIINKNLRVLVAELSKKDSTHVT